MQRGFDFQEMHNFVPTFTVSEIGNFIKGSLEEAFPKIKVVGEVSNFAKHMQSGHIYLSLKDSDALIKVVCFKQDAEKITFLPQDGMKVTVTGRLSAFVKSSNYQVIATDIEVSGKGELWKLFEELKLKLSKEGLFEESTKKPLPFLPSKIGIITAKGGAVLHDILKTLEARMPTKVIVYPAIMQGVNSAKSVISGIKAFNKAKAVDVIIIARGGGSFEDLFEFNNEDLVRAAFKSQIPIISAIGHETDFTLLDFVADKRASTPTASVILATPSRDDLVLNLLHYKRSISSYALNLIEKKALFVREYAFKIKSISTDIEQKKFDLERKKSEITKLSSLCLNEGMHVLEKIYNDIKLYDYANIFNLGFAMVLNEEGKLLKSAKDFKINDKIKINLKDGVVNSIVTGETLL